MYLLLQHGLTTPPLRQMRKQFSHHAQLLQRFSRTNVRQWRLNKLQRKLPVSGNHFPGVRQLLDYAANMPGEKEESEKGWRRA